MNRMNPTHTREQKLNRYLGLSYILAGAFFLFDPYISIIDLLPDCIGYLLVMIGLFRFADLDDRLAEARKGVRNLALVGVARIIATPLAFGFVSRTEQPVFLLLVLFTLGVLDCIVLIPMWKNFSGGLLYLGSRNDAVVMFDRRGLGGKTRIHNMVERYTAVSTVFFILREALAILPELTVLTHEKGGAELGQGTQYYDFVGLFRGMGILVSLLLGVIWLILTVRFIHKLKGDKPFFEKLTVKYRTEVLTRHELWAMRAVRSSMLCLIVATVLSLDLYLDGVNVLPDLLPAVMLFLSVWFLRRYAGKNYPVMAVTAIYGLVAAVSWGLQFKYFKYSDTADIFRRDETYTRWLVTVFLQALAAALFLLSVGLILRSLYRMVRKYTGLHAFRDGSSYAAERTEAIHRLIRKKLILVMAFAVLAVFSTLFHWGIVPQLDEGDFLMSLGIGGMHTDNAFTTIVITVFQLLARGYWFIDLCVGGILIGVTVSAAGEISEQMEYSYMMKD